MGDLCDDADPRSIDVSCVSARVSHAFTGDASTGGGVGYIRGVTLEIGITNQFCAISPCPTLGFVLEDARLTVASGLGSPISTGTRHPVIRIGNFGNDLIRRLVLFLLDLTPGDGPPNITVSQIFIFDLPHWTVVAHIIASADKFEPDRICAVTVARLVSVGSTGYIIVIYPG
jgi:hypothetical protein